LIQQDIQVILDENLDRRLAMKMLGLWTAAILVILLTGCKNRFETYEPYSYYDERMAAAQKEQQYQRDYYESQGYTGNEFNDDSYYRNQPAPAPVPARKSSAAAPAANSDSNSSPEVPFDASRGEKHASNIGAMDYPFGV
jgi:hypothetical protein